VKLTVRHLFRGKGHHRAPATPTPLHVPLNDLLGTPWPEPRRPYGAAVIQAWKDCAPCGKATAGVVHADGWTCGECLTTAGAGETA